MGRVQRPGNIEFSGDRDVFQVTTRQAGLLSIRQRAVPGSGLDSLLRVRDENGAELAFNDDDGASLNSLLQIPVVQNQTLFIEAGAFGSSRGRYELIVSAGDPVTDDAGDTVATAVSLNLNATRTTIRRGNIDRPGDHDVFRIVPATSGLLTIRQRAEGGNPLDTFVRVLDANGQQLAANDDDGFSLNSRVSVLATGGEALFIEAGAFGQSAGGYVLEIASQAGVSDDFGNDIASAHTTAGGVELRGEIELAGDVDVFQVQATETGLLTIRQRATRGSSIDSFLRILDSAGQVLAVNDDDRFSLNSVAKVSVTAGDTIYVESGAFSTSTGRYIVTLASGADDFTDVLNDSTTTIELSSEGSGTRSGVINFDADADVFRFTPASDSVVTINLTAGAAGSVDPFLQILSSSEELILVDDDGGEGLNSRATFDAKSGETYYVRATSFGGTTGAYQLRLSSSFELDDVGNTFSDARQFVLDELGTGSSQFQLNGQSDVDVFQFTATVSGSAAVQIGQTDGTAPGRIFVFEQTDDASDTERSRIRVARDQDNDGLVSFSVTNGTTYYVEVAQGSGLTDLSVTTDTTAEDESKIDEDVAGDAADLFRLGLASILVGESDDSSLDVFAATLEETAAFIGDKLGTDEVILILGLDPVDYVVTDVSGRQAGFTATDGEINEVGSNVFNSGDGVAELLIVRNPTADLFQLDLVGVGTDFRGGAAYITSDGIQTTTFDGTLTKGNLEIALDFSNTESSTSTPQQTQSTETIQVGNFLASISDDIGDGRSEQVPRLDGSSNQATDPVGLSTDEFAALVEDLSASIADGSDERRSSSSEATSDHDAAASLDDLIGSLLGWLDGDESEEANAQEADPVDRTWRSVAQSIFQFSSSAIELMSDLLQATTEQAAETEQATGQPDDQPDDSNTASEESDRKEPKRVSINEGDESVPEGQTEEESAEKPVKTARATEASGEEVASEPRTAT